MKYTIKRFNKQFSNDDVCLEYIFKARYGDCKECPKCNKKCSYYRIRAEKNYECAYCANKIAPLANTIFHKSCTSLKSWFYCIYLFSVSKNGISGREIQRHTGVTYKTAWRMGKQIRKLFNDDAGFLQNIIEVDETFIGGKERNKHDDKKEKGTQGRSTKNKEVVIGALEREGNVKAEVIKNTKSKTIVAFIEKHITSKSTIHTDEYKSYNKVGKLDYTHKIINHKKKQYVKGDIHTNGIEGFWSQLKRSISGTFHMVSAKYLQSYVNECAYRYNNRLNETPIFFSMLALVK